MTGLTALLGKEIMEQLRTYKFLIVAGIFTFFGILTPLMLKYLPEILRLAGEQIPIEVPPPTAVQSLTEYAGTIGQVGVLVAVLVAMGAIAGELRQGTGVMVLSKPVSHAAFVIAKLFALALSFIVSLAIASAFAFGYTVALIEGAAVAAFLLTNLLLVLFLVFALAVTLLFSSFFRSSLAAGGLALALLIGQAGLSVLPLIGDYMPGKLLAWSTNALTGAPGGYWWSLGITIAATILCTYLAQWRLKYRDI